MSAAADIRVPAEPAQWLATFALNALSQQVQDEDLRGCCFHHCGPCGALMRLAGDGRLDALVHPTHRAEHVSWWDASRNRVDRQWLISALTALCATSSSGCDGCGDCHHDQVPPSAASQREGGRG